MTEVSKLQVVVDADTKSAESSLGKLGQSISTGFGIAAGTKLLDFGLGALSDGIKGSLGEAAEFQKQLSGIKAVSGASAEEMAALSKLSLKLGADTSFSAKESAKGIEELVKGGVSIADIMGGAAKASLDLAAAGEIDVGEAATIASNAMSQFGLKGSEMGRVADLIAGAANASSLDVSDFKYSLQAAGAVAATVGFSFDDLAQGIAVMGKAGITGSDAGTSLKTMMMNLEPSTKKARSLMYELGIITEDGANKFFDASGKVKSMSEVSQVLQDALAGQTEQQRLANLQTLFGSDAIRAAAILSNEGAAGFTAMGEAMTKVSAASVAEERLANLSGSIEKFKGSMSTAAVVLGSALLGPLQKLVDWGTEMLNAAMPSIEAFAEQLPGAIESFGESISGFVADYWPPIRETLAALWEWLSPKLGDALTWLKTTGWPALQEASAAIVAFIKDPLLPIIATLVEALQKTLGAAVSWFFETGWPKLIEGGQAVWSFVKTDLIPIIDALYRGLKTMLEPAVDWFIKQGWPLLVSEGNKAKSLAGELTEFWGKLNDQLAKNGAYTDIKNLFGEIAEVGRTLLNDVIIPLLGDVQPLAGDFKGLSDNLAWFAGEMIKEGVRQLRAFVAEVRDAIDALKTAVGWYKQLKQTANAAAEWVGKQVSGSNAPDVPTPEWSGGDVNAMASGGWITEPIAGIGRSGRRYLLGEAGPEYVSPAGQMRSSGGVPSIIQVPITIGNRVIEELWITGRDLAVRRGRATAGAVG